MAKRFQNELSLRKKVAGLYLGLSFLVGCSVILSLNQGLSELLLSYPWTLSFTLLSIGVFTSQIDSLSELSLFNETEHLLVTHYLLLLCMSVELKEIGAHYMSVVPIMALLAHILNNWTLSKKEKTDRITGYLFFMAVAFPLPFSYRDTSEGQTLAVVTLVSFFCWQISILFFTHFQFEVITSKLIHIFMNSNKGSNSGPDHPLLKDRYFFHDLINQTHAMNLSLRYKILKNEGLSSLQTKEMSEQLCLLQDLVKEHFGFHHKNLAMSREEDNFSRLFFVTDTLVNAFLPKASVDSFIRVTDPLELSDRVIIPLSAWQRVVTNLIKNASEAKCKSFEINFIFEKDSLVIETKNDFFRLNHRDSELGAGLANVIKNIDYSEQKGLGLGLEAIHLISDEHGGSFDFAIQNSFWCSKVSMKFSNSELLARSSKSSEISKKAS